MIRGLTIHGLDARMEGVRFVTLLKDRPRATSEFNFDDVRFLKMRRLQVRSLELRADELRDFLAERLEGVVNDVEKLEMDGTIKLSGYLKLVVLHAELSVALQEFPRSLVIEVKSLKAGVTPIPPRFLGAMGRVVVPLEDNPETPFAIDLPGITIADGKLTVP